MNQTALPKIQLVERKNMKSKIVIIFGLMPVSGIFQYNISSLKFSWFHFRTIYATLTLIGFLILSCIQLWRFFIYEVDMLEIQRIWYFVKCSFTSILFLKLARNWHMFLTKWQLVDKEMVRYGWPTGLNRKINKILAGFCIAFLVNYFLIQIHRIKDDIIEGNIEFSLSTWNHIQKDKKFSYVYQILPYDFFSGILLLFIHIQVLVAGTFVDLFIIIISIVLAARQQQVTERIKNVAMSGNALEDQWMELREDYNRLECLCKFINSQIGSIILLSFTGNLGIILMQLFNSLKVSSSILGIVYLYYNIGFILIKVIYVCMFGSTINEESKKPLRYLYSASAAAYNVEIDRLIRQISRDAMALSGMNIFQITRNIILKIAGSIVTYELVVIQFAGDFLREKEIGNRTFSL